MLFDCLSENIYILPFFFFLQPQKILEPKTLKDCTVVFNLFICMCVLSRPTPTLLLSVYVKYWQKRANTEKYTYILFINSWQAAYSIEHF